MNVVREFVNAVSDYLGRPHLNDWYQISFDALGWYNAVEDKSRFSDAYKAQMAAAQRAYDAAMARGSTRRCWCGERH